MKKTLCVVVLSLFVACSQVAYKKPSSVGSFATYALFSPIEGEEAFNKMFEIIRNAQEEVYITIYSWSNIGLSDALIYALDNNPKLDIKIVIRGELSRKSSLKDKLKELELAGAVIKRTTKSMHEKFVIVDNKYLINSSANMSSGAKKKYSENFVFHTLLNKNDKQMKELIEQFRHEFSVLFNSSIDVITHDEGPSPIHDDFHYFQKSDILNTPHQTKGMRLVSSSMNFKLRSNKRGSSNAKKGQHYSLVRRKESKKQTTFVQDLLIQKIKEAKESILVCLNHFNSKEVADALVSAAKRGVDVQLAVDNQEYKNYFNNKEMTIYFLQQWKKIKGNKDKQPPVRVKYYSHNPTPRFWLLNHHKFFLFDYQSDKHPAYLLSGSYNVSMNAEHNQFDNLVLYEGQQYSQLYFSFYEEFNRLWYLNRDEGDKPLPEYLDEYKELSRNGYQLHSKNAISLTWDEIETLRKDVIKLAPGLFKDIYKNKDCMYYQPKDNTYKVCPRD